MTVKFDWINAVSIPKGRALAKFCLCADRMRNDLYRIGPSMYCVVDDCEVKYVDLSLICFIWASSDGAVLKAYFNDVESDDCNQVIASPPSQLLPNNSSFEYASILAGLKCEESEGVIEYATYRIMTDGAFVHKAIESKRAIYYFRSEIISATETPYAILWKMNGM